MRRDWTIRIVSEDEGSGRNLRAGRPVSVAAGAALLAVLGLLGLGTVLTARDVGDAAELRPLPAEAEVREVGGGGARSGTSAFDDRLRRLEQLVRRADLLSASLAEAADSARLNRDVFLSRPSVHPVTSDEAWISSSFDPSRYHPILRNSRPHEGIDISAPAGTEIRATARGLVTFAGSMPGYGKLVEVDHGYGYRTRYAHASRIRVRFGDRVERGDVVGEVGQTGLSTAPNLHYEVLVGGRPVDPRPYLLEGRPLP